jgi:hypothetical protein
MFRNLMFLGLSLIGSALIADADISLVQDLVGTYPVVEYLGKVSAAGKAEIFVTDTEVGVRLIPLKLASHPVPALTFSSPRKNTVLKRDAKGVYQTYENGAEQARIDYIFEKGFLLVDASQCTSSHCVKETTVSLSQGGAPGLAVDSLSFLKKVRGNYVISEVGGEPAHAETNSAEWAESEEPGVDMLRFPYCQPTGCDPGFLNLKQSDIKVFQKDAVYTLLVKAGSKLNHYSWEEKADGSFVFTHYQFKLLTKEIVALEYVLKRS